MTVDVRARDFVGAVYDGLDGYLNIRTLPPVENGFVHTTDLDGFERFVKPRRDRNCYLGVAVRLTDADGSRPHFVRWVEEHMPEVAAGWKKADDGFYAYWVKAPYGTPGS